MRKEKKVYQLKITLKGAKPPIWRRVLATGNTNLGQLHNLIQNTMGWYNYHLHQFMIRGQYYAQPGSGFEAINENKVRLDQVIPEEKFKFQYEYDFGDSWVHNIQVEAILPPESGKQYPVCIKGKRACPPEDVGGVGGYADFLDAIKDKEHPDHNEMLEWVGGSFDPEKCDLGTL